jgi:hypothetical protein
VSRHVQARARLATSLLAAAAIAAIVALLALGAAAGRRAAGGLRRRHRLRLPDDRVHGGAWDQRRRERLGNDRRQACLRRSRATGACRTRSPRMTPRPRASEVLALVFNHEHIVRLRVLRNGVVLDDFGGRSCSRRSAERCASAAASVGTFELSVQDDAGYRKLARAPDRRARRDPLPRRDVMSDIAVGDSAAAGERHGHARRRSLPRRLVHRRALPVRHAAHLAALQSRPPRSRGAAARR